MSDEVNFPSLFRFSVDFPEPSCLRDICILEHGHIGLLFSNYYMNYDLINHWIHHLTRLQYPLQYPRLLNNNIVALSSHKNKIVMLKGETGQILKETEIKVDDKYTQQEFELIVFETTGLMAVVFRQKWMLLRMVYIFDSSLQLISTKELQISFLSKYDTLNSLINYNQTNQNVLKLTLFNVQTSTTETISIDHGIGGAQKPLLMSVKQLSDNECILGINYTHKGQWYIVNFDRSTIRLCYSGLCLGQLLRVNSKLKETLFFGYNPQQKRPLSKLVITRDGDESEELQMRMPTNSNFDYSSSRYMLTYKPNLKQGKTVDLEAIKVISKRALVLHLVLNSHLSNFGNGIVNPLFNVITFQRKRQQKYQPENLIKIQRIPGMG